MAAQLFCVASTGALILAHCRTQISGISTDNFLLARYSGIIPRSPPVGREGGHFNVVARRGRHWAVPQPSARSQHGTAWNPAQSPNLACFSRKLLAECNSGRSDSAFLHIVRS